MITNTIAMEKTKADNQSIINLLYQLAHAYLEKGDYDNAIDKFKKLIGLGEENEKVYLNLSKAYILKERFDQEAQECFEKTLEYDSENPVINVILSQLYLEANREDDLAVTVYQTALQQNPQNADELITTLIKISFRQENYELAEKLMQQLMKNPEKITSIVPFYIARQWQHQKFDRVSQFLKQLIGTQKSAGWYRWYVLNLVQAEQQLGAEFSISLDDLNICLDYLNHLDSFDRLLDVYLYPAIERFNASYANRVAREESKPVQEYELFLLDNSFTNIWEKGINKQKMHHQPEVVLNGDIWKKLKPWQIETNGSIPEFEHDNQSSLDADLIQQQAQSLMIIRTAGGTALKMKELLQGAISNAMGGENALVSCFHSTDGIILFWKDLNCSIRAAHNFIKEQYLQDNQNSSPDQQPQILIHNLSAKRGTKSKSIVENLQLTLSAFQLENELFLHSNQGALAGNNNSKQIFITASVAEQMNEDVQFTIKPTDIVAQHPTSKKSIKIYRMLWDDVVAKMSRGEIKNIGKFNLLRELHSNDTCASFKAMDSFLERLVVVKILRPNVNGANAYDSLAKHFIQKAKILGKMMHHNIALIYDFGEEKEFCYIAREYVEGEPLKIQLSIKHNINWIRTLKLCLSISQTLNIAHQNNIFHCRLKLNNIFISMNNEVKITDFQVVPLTLPWKMCQEPSLKSLTYLSPEQINNESIDSRTDIFSLGVIMYELLTGHNPFWDDTSEKIMKNILKKNPDPVATRNRDLPERLNDIVARTMDKSPENRYHNLYELESQLNEIIKSYDS